MSDSLRVWLTLISLSTLGVVSHLLPHPMGVSTVGAISLFAAAYLPKSLVLGPVLITVAVVDGINGTYAMAAMWWVYLAYLLAAVVLVPLLARVTVPRYLAASVGQALVFYLVSNLTPMAMAYYPPTVDGWLACYIAGLPFLLKGIGANLAFGGVGFAAVWIVRSLRAHRIAAAERH